jgi:transcriptional regulator with XRE-family HTH domain
MCCLRRLLACVVSVSKSSPHQKTIGETIRKYRNAAKMSQERLAEKADLHPVYFGQVERGEQTASVNALMRIAKALRVRVRDLVADI